MKRYQVITYRWLGLVLCSLASLVGRAQGPTLDPGFAATSLYRPAPVRQALRQPDGKTLLLGDMVQVQGQPAGQLTRLLAGTQQPDAAFNANVADLTGTVSRVLLLPDGRMLLTSLFGRNGAQGRIGVGGQSRAGLFMLQSNGLADAGYNANLPSGDYNVYDALLQPDGKVLLAGFFTSGPAPTITQLLRLNADGSPDTAFQSAIGSSITSGSTYCLALQPDGKLLVGGDFRGFNGMPRHSLVRLLPTGAVDVAFADPFINSGGARVRALALQADGGIVLASEPSPNSSCQACFSGVTRLLPTGAIDVSFDPSGYLPLLEIFFGSSVSTPPPLLVQPDSKILVAGITRNSNAPASPVSRLFRFLPTGQPDPGFANLTAVPTNNAQSVLGSVQLLPNGQLLVAAGSPNLGLLNFSPATAAPTGVALLNANGSRDAGFNPTVQDYGTVAAVVQQTDGKLLIGGDFTYYNGQPARNLARLLPDGALDVAFQANGGNADDVVTSLLLLPTGQLAVGGRFRLLAGSVRTGLGQLLPSGALDPGFAPAVINNPGGLLASMWQLTRQADGKLLGIYGYDNSIRYLVRYDGTTGQSDTSFQPLSPGPNQPVVEPADLLPQPDGSIVVVGALNLATFPVGAKVPVWRLLPTGALDQSFPLPLPNADGMGTALTQDAAGRLYVAGLFANFGGQPGTAGLVRLLASGQPDASFQVAPGVVSGNYHYTEALTVQPNGRVLLGGSYGPGTVGSDTGTRRLLADGSPDASYAPGNGPVGDAPTRRAGAVRRLLVQADGKLVVAGSFGSVGGLPVTGLARLLDPNVLGMRSSQAAGRPFTAWPVPAHHTLHLALEAATGSRQVELLNVLGQVVQTQAAPAATLSLNVQALPAGPYVLRVQDAAGVATRRVVLY